MFFNSFLRAKAQEIIDLAAKKNVKIATAESCTGGLIAALLTEISGSSKVFERGFVTYSNEAKIQEIQVAKEVLDEFGAVSEKVALQMAQGVLKNSLADVVVSVTGIAGPDGGSKEKQIGLVYIAIAGKNFVKVRKFNFAGDRNQVREAAVIEALNLILGSIL